MPSKLRPDPASAKNGTDTVVGSLLLSLHPTPPQEIEKGHASLGDCGSQHLSVGRQYEHPLTAHMFVLRACDAPYQAYDRKEICAFDFGGMADVLPIVISLKFGNGNHAQADIVRNVRDSFSSRSGQNVFQG